MKELFLQCLAPQLLYPYSREITWKQIMLPDSSVSNTFKHIQKHIDSRVILVCVDSEVILVFVDSRVILLWVNSRVILVWVDSKVICFWVDSRVICFWIERYCLLGYMYIHYMFGWFCKISLHHLMLIVFLHTGHILVQSVGEKQCSSSREARRRLVSWASEYLCFL